MVRDVTYGTRPAKPRQRYKCTLVDGSKSHRFTPPLPRDHVHENEEQCQACKELRGLHRGETAAARRHSWSTHVVARGLEQWAAGGSYAEVSRWALRTDGANHTSRSGAEAEAESVDAEKRKVSQASKDARNAWHTAADWCEAFGPVIYEPVEERPRATVLAEHVRLDALIDESQPPTRPQVMLVDDVPCTDVTSDAPNGRDVTTATSFSLSPNSTRPFPQTVTTTTRSSLPPRPSSGFGWYGPCRNQIPQRGVSCLMSSGTNPTFSLLTFAQESQRLLLTNSTVREPSSSRHCGISPKPSRRRLSTSRPHRRPPRPVRNW